MAKVLLVLYPDPVTGYPPVYARDSIPVLHGYPGGQTLPTPSAIDFTPGQLLGCVSGELGLRKFLESGGHQLVVTSDKEGPDSEFERELPDADIVISQPFWPAYLTAERIAKAKNLKLALTAGIGSDHVDLDAAIARGITVAEVTFCNSISVAEHAVMQILALVRNFVPSHQWATEGGWNIADCVERSYDVEGMDVGVIAAAASALPCCGGWPPSMSTCITPTPGAFQRSWSKNWASPTTPMRRRWRARSTCYPSMPPCTRRPITCSTRS